jgi:hypothetical protein
MRQLRCHLQFDRIWLRLDDRSRALVAGVVLQNRSVGTIAEALGISANLAMQQLVAALDVLVDRLNVKADLESGKVLAA